MQLFYLPNIQAGAQALPDEEARHAVMLGRAMRFGAMFSVGGTMGAGELRYFPRKQVLEMVLRPERQALFGEVAQQRFQALAKTLGVTTSLRIARQSEAQAAKPAKGIAPLDAA